MVTLNGKKQGCAELTELDTKSQGVSIEQSEGTIIKVLHVDDEASLLSTAKQILEMQGNFAVETATSVDEALEKMKEKTFDVIISDYQMPSRDGLEFLKELRQNRDKTPFIMFTGKGREEVAIEALNLGADRYINKTGNPRTVYGELTHGINQIVKSQRMTEHASEASEQMHLMADVGAMMHNLLFSYERAVSKIHGSTCDVFVHSTLEFLKKIEEKRSLKLFSGENLTESFANLAEFFLRAGVVKEFKIERTGADKYLLRIDGCIWSRHIHAELNTEDSTCPYALIAMAVFESLTGKRVEVAVSTYSAEGTETVIEPLGNI